MIEVGTFCEIAMVKGGFVLKKWTPSGEKNEDGEPVGPETIHVTSDPGVLERLVSQAIQDVTDYGFEFKVGGSDGTDKVKTPQ